MKISVALVLAVILSLATAGVAATSQGDSEITLFGTILYQEYADAEEGEDDDATSVTAGGQYGYFFSDALEVAGTGMGIWTEDIDIYNIGAAVKYHFLTEGNTVPYAGGQVNASFFDAEDDDGSGVLYGPLVGVKFFVSEKTTVFVEYQYHLFGGDIEDFIDNEHAIVFGVSFLLR